MEYRCLFQCMCSPQQAPEQALDEKGHQSYFLKLDINL